MEQLRHELMMISDRIQSLVECNRGHFQQIPVFRTEIILQRLRQCEQTSRQVEQAELCSKIVMLQATVERQAVRNARLTHRVDELERLLDSRDARPYVSSGPSSKPFAQVLQTHGSLLLQSS